MSRGSGICIFVGQVATQAFGEEGKRLTGGNPDQWHQWRSQDKAPGLADPLGPPTVSVTSADNLWEYKGTLEPVKHQQFLDSL